VQQLLETQAGPAKNNGMTTERVQVHEWASLGAILVAMTVLLHGGLVWGSEVLCGGDIVNQAHPLTVFWVSGPWLAGWVPYSFSGRPFFADIQSALLYPPRALFRLGFPVEHVTTLLCLAHSLFGAVGMYLLGRVRFGHMPALMGAVLWLAGGYTLLRYTNGVVTLIYALAWVPWVWWAVERCGPRNPAMTAFLALSAALLFLAGSPQMVLITGLGMTVWALGRLAFEEKNWKARLVLSGHFAVAGLLAFVIVFPQFHATLEYTRLSVGRGGSAHWEYLSADSLGPWLLISNLAPEFFDAGNAEGVYWGSQVGFMETNAYLGIAPLMLALFGVIMVVARWSGVQGAERRWFVCLCVLFVAGMLIAFGRFTPLFRLLYDFIPGFNLFRVPARWLLWPFATGILLAAAGLEIALRGVPHERPANEPGESASSGLAPMTAWSITASAFVILLLVLVVFAEPVMRACGFNPAATTPDIARLLADKSRSALAWALGLAFVTSLVLALGMMRRIPEVVLPWMMLVIVAVDLLRFWQPYRQPLPHLDFTREEMPTETIYHKISASAFNEWFYPRTPLIELLDSEPQGRYFYTDWLYSYLVDEYTREIYTERGMVHGLENMRGYQPLQLESYARDFARIADVPLTNPSATSSFLHAPAIMDRTMLDAYHATRIVTYEGTRGEPADRERLEKLGLLREAVFPFGLEVWRNPHAAGWAWLSKDASWPGLDGKLAEGGVALLDRQAGRSTYEVEVPEGGAWLHFSEVEYPGWEIHARSPETGEFELIGDGRSVHFPTAGSLEVEHVFRLPAASRFILPLSGLVALGLMAFMAWRVTFVGPRADPS
jgi:hypothetical protein